MKDILLKSEEPKTRAQVVAFLREIADKIEQNKLVLKKGNNEIDLKIPNQLELEIEVEKKTKKGKPPKMELEIELEWYEGEESQLELG